MTTKVKSAKQLALLFFSIGTLLLVLQILFQDINTITIVGLYYLSIAVVCNLFFVTVLLIGLLLKEDTEETFKAIGVLVINLPIAYCYAQIVFKIVL